MAAKTPVPVTLEGRHARLEPLHLEHTSELFESSGKDDEVWRWLRRPTPQVEQDMRAFVVGLLSEQRLGIRIPFAVRIKSIDRIIGTTSYQEIFPEDERLEIGWTWLGRAFWGSPINSECRLLLLSHAFEDLGMERVAIRINSCNERAQAAIERIGWVREGVFRHYTVRPNGTRGDTIYFSLLSAEWPTAKARLIERLHRG
ncbi:MAG: GNAT family N-acetyltransferase [Egibacteraceae bacterium]